MGLFRRFTLARGSTLQFRLEAFNVTNTPQFNNPGANVSSLRLNPDGSIRSLNGFTEITSTRGSRSERQFRVGLRLGF
jgi:hypothetical protein